MCELVEGIVTVPLDPSKADLPDDIGQWTFVGR
jgi:hypothetical protein